MNFFESERLREGATFHPSPGDNYYQQDKMMSFMRKKKCSGKSLSAAIEDKSEGTSVEPEWIVPAPPPETYAVTYAHGKTYPRKVTIGH